MKALLISQGPNARTERMKPTIPWNHGAIHRCGRSAVVDTTFYEEVYQYRTVEERKKNTRDNQKSSRENEYRPWQEPEFAESLTLAADAYQVACAERDTGTVLCKMLARYGDIVVRLNANRDSASMSLEEFKSVIESVDSPFR
jgi:hypothetical protein